jgi:hypothetical protein
MNPYRDNLKALVLNLFVSYEKEDNVNRIRSYVDDLAEMNLDIKTVDCLLKTARQNNKYLPTICEIISPLMEKINNNSENDISEKWEFFLSKAFSPYNKLDDWAYTIKKRIGWGRVENATNNDVPWIKKEFYELYKQVRSEKLELLSDNRNWKLIGDTWALMPATNLSSISNELKKISETLKNNDNHKYLTATGGGDVS